jgi:hypothetical protein
MGIHFFRVTYLISIMTATAGWVWLIFIGVSGVLGFSGMQ